MTKGLSDEDLQLLKGLAGTACIRIETFALSRLMAFGLVAVDEISRKLIVTETGAEWIERIDQQALLRSRHL